MLDRFRKEHETKCQIGCCSGSQALHFRSKLWMFLPEQRQLGTRYWGEGQQAWCEVVEKAESYVQADSFAFARAPDKTSQQLPPLTDFHVRERGYFVPSKVEPTNIIQQMNLTPFLAASITWDTVLSYHR